MLKLDSVDVRAGSAALNVGANPRHLSVSGDGSRLYVSRFITPPLPGESTADGADRPRRRRRGACSSTRPRSASCARSCCAQRQAGLRDPGPRHPELPRRRGDLAGRHAGLGAVEAGQRRSAARCAMAANLNFQNTVRAISSRIDLAAGAEDLRARIDHDNASVASAAALRPARRLPVRRARDEPRSGGASMRTDAGRVFRFDVGRAPQGLAVSADGSRLYVNNFMDRTVGVFDLAPLLQDGAVQRAAAGDAGRGRDREARRATCSTASSSSTTRATRASRATLHELRDLPQRRRQRRPRLGPDRAWAKACARASPRSAARPKCSIAVATSPSSSSSSPSRKTARLADGSRSSTCSYWIAPPPSRPAPGADRRGGRACPAGWGGDIVGDGPL